MTKVRKSKTKSDFRQPRVISHPLPSCSKKVPKNVCVKKKCYEASERKDWIGATCSVCLEFPHKAVLLLCSSYHKGCRPYMCATSHRYSNCLEQYKKAYSKVSFSQSSQQINGLMDNSTFSSGAGQASKKTDVPELLCPLCRGQVKGWTVVEPARKYLNKKKRTCMLDNCSFIGTYMQLRKHVIAKHPLAQPRKVDPILEEKWKRLEGERERNDVISTIISSTPGAVVLGDYVLEPRQSRSYSADYTNLDNHDVFLPLDPFGSLYSLSRSTTDYTSLDEDDFGMYYAAGNGSGVGVPVAGRGFRRIVFGRSRRRRRGRAYRNR